MTDISGTTTATSPPALASRPLWAALLLMALVVIDDLLIWHRYEDRKSVV